MDVVSGMLLEPAAIAIVGLVTIQGCSGETAVGRQDLACTYLAHHELESVNIIVRFRPISSLPSPSSFPALFLFLLLLSSWICHVNTTAACAGVYAVNATVQYVTSNSRALCGTRMDQGI